MTRRDPEASRGGSNAIQWVKGDLRTGEGIATALQGVEAVVHTASDPIHAPGTDIEGTRRLVSAARDAHVSHFLFVSIAGIDRIPLAYYRAKLACERIVSDSGVPHSILRATQFHWFVDLQLHLLSRIPRLLPIPAGFRVQSIGTGDVALELCHGLAAGPRGRLPDIGGPELMTLKEAARAWLAVRRLNKSVFSIPIPGRTAAAFRAGYNTVPDRPRGTETWRAWLDRNVSVAPQLA